jgi:hypothetical protein
MIPKDGLLQETPAEDQDRGFVTDIRRTSAQRTEMEDEREYKNPLSNPKLPGLQNKELPIDGTKKANPKTKVPKMHPFLRRENKKKPNYTWDLTTVIEKPGGLESERVPYISCKFRGLPQ